MREDKAAIISLKDEFNQQQCLDTMQRVQATPGVIAASFEPEGCFGLNLHKIFVVTQAGSQAPAKIAALPGVVKFEPLP